MHGLIKEPLKSKTMLIISRHLLLQDGPIPIAFKLNPPSTEFYRNIRTNLFVIRTAVISVKSSLEIYISVLDPSNHNTRVGKLSQEYTLSYLTDYNLTFWISFEHRSRIQVLVGTQEGHLILFELSENDDKDARTVALSFNENIAIKAMAFTYFDEQWFVILHSSGDSKWIRFYQKIGRGLEGRQTITLDGETDFDLIYVKGVHYLAVVTFRTSPYQSMLT
ncbi:uncharacterized protein TNCT_175711 [Trichonephila clavata]|uniref:Uncharacterized protein n=1 Tax=Trichonephila clavata TaxID=2740835 RepID=A0A8X6HT84_TRICU|nr:uncharacterized protein TNCT_175711 [Trichonephila clavata]